jgi:hypothetical protein
MGYPRNWTVGDDSGNQALTNDDHLYQEHINELRIAINNNTSFNVLDYGAKGDGVTDDYAAIMLAVADIPTTGGKLYFPAGIYLSSGAIVASNRPISIIGDGMGVSVLQFTSATPNGAIDLDFNDITQNCNIKDLTLLAGNANNGTAINLAWVLTGSSTHVSLNIKDVEITSSDGGTTNYWTDGFIVYDAWNAVIKNINVRGANTKNLTQTGITLLGRSNDVRISECYFASCYYAIKSAGVVEGLHLSHNIYIYCQKGFYAVPTTGTPPLIFISKGMFDCFEAGIDIINNGTAHIDHNFFSKRGESTENYTHILLNTSCNGSVITNNNMQGVGPSGTTHGIVIGANINTTIMGNLILQCDAGKGIWLTSSSTKIIVALNKLTNGASDITDEGTSNEVHYNY